MRQLYIHVCIHIGHSLELFKNNTYRYYCRLQRVKQRQEYSVTSTTEAASDVKDCVCMFEDYAILSRQKKTFLLGNVIRMTCKGQRSNMTYKNPVPYDSEKKNDITLTMQIFKQVEDRENQFEHTKCEVMLVPFTDVISHVNLSVNEENNLEINNDELQMIKAEVSKLLTPRARKRNAPNSTNQRDRESGNQTQNSINVQDDGTVRILVEPQTSAPDGVRRSSRTRTVVVYES